MRDRNSVAAYISFNNAHKFRFCAENWNRFTRQIDKQRTIKSQKVLIKIRRINNTQKNDDEKSM